MWEFLCSPLRNNPGIRPRIYVGYKYLDELERDENAAAESVVVNHYTIAV